MPDSGDHTTTAATIAYTNLRLESTATATTIHTPKIALITPLVI
ncbi:hypothetical protein [Nostoc flagelliforme]|nr:hypothetical protein [Nostoc flagelliforme]